MKSEQPGFMYRERCGICDRADSIEVLVSVGYSDTRLFEPLLARYKGKVRSEHFIDARYELHFCRRCDFLFQAFVPNDALTNCIYSYPAARITESLTKVTRAPLAYATRYALLSEVAGVLLNGIPSEKTVLDFGCGWGAFLAMARAFGFQVCGIEVSEERLAFLRSQNILCATSIIQLSERAFDFIYCDQVFEHVNDPQALIHELASHLKPNAILYISVPDCRLALKDIFKKHNATNLLRKSTYPLEHINSFTHQSLIRLAASAGLVPIHPRTLARKLFSQVSVWRNAHLAQYALETLYRSRTTTSLFFMRKP